MKDKAIIAGPLLALLTFVVLSHFAVVLELSSLACATLGVAVLMVSWWVTEAIPIAATALLPLLLFPLFGITKPDALGGAYAHRLIFLFLGGFLMALAMERCGLLRRFALVVLARIGTSPTRIVAGFMMVTAFVSMWVSNTSTTIIMLPIAIGVVDFLSRFTSPSPRFATALFLGIAYAASIGGIGTLIGTPPNALFAAFVGREYGDTYSFVAWLKVGVPIVLLLLPLAWLILTRVVFRLEKHTGENGSELFSRELEKLGPITASERRALIVFVITATTWIAQPFLAKFMQGVVSIDDTGIAMAAALSLFVIPGNDRKPLLTWEATSALPWGVLLLFGGGLALADAMSAHGVTSFLAGHLASLKGIHHIWILLALTTMTVFLSELTSNTATAAALLPILGATAEGLGIHPYLLMIPAIVANSTSFMLPAGTPPNALVFATGKVSMRAMCRAGFVLNVLSIVVITIFFSFFG